MTIKNRRGKGSDLITITRSEYNAVFWVGIALGVAIMGIIALFVHA